MDSPYVILDFGNWHLKEDAPEQLRLDFEEWMRQYKELEAKGIAM